MSVQNGKTKTHLETEEEENNSYYLNNEFASERFYMVCWELHSIVDMELSSYLSALMNLAFLDEREDKTWHIVFDSKGKPQFSEENGKRYFKCTRKRLIKNLYITEKQEKRLSAKLRRVHVMDNGKRKPICDMTRRNINFGERPVRFIHIDIPLIRKKVKEARNKQNRLKNKSVPNPTH